MRYLINCSGLHAGGGVQVAASFLHELVLMKAIKDVQELSVLASTAVDENLRAVGADIGRFAKYQVYDSRATFSSMRALARIVEGYDVVFTVFGPLYLWQKRVRSIVGFAQAWIIYPGNECYQQMPVVERTVARLKYWIQKQYFRRADVFIVESEHVREGLIRELGVSPTRIRVIHNCISAIYLNEPWWAPVEVPMSGGSLKLGYVGRNYLHKNTSLFPHIVASLERRHSIHASLFVTFTESEWAACTEEFRACCINIGPLSVAQCPNFYRQMDAVVLPSLLESFSVTPLEAMAMGKSVFVADRRFNRDVCGIHAYYFDPESADSAADAIARVFRGAGPDPNRLAKARDHALGFSNSRERAVSYLEVMRDASWQR